MDENEVQEKFKSFFKTVKEMTFPELTEEETNATKDMIWSEKEAFSLHPEDIGSVPDLKLHLHTTDEIPVQKKYNSIPKNLFNDVRNHINMMLDRKWIEKSESPWSSPVVLAKKKDGGFRLCCDFRAVNKKTVPDKHPLPKVQETLDNLQGSNYFTVLDLSRAYYQGYVTEESRPKTGFLTPFGFYQWIRIPFGVSNAVPVFQRFMESLLEDCRNDYALPYIDDTIVYSKTIAEHIGHIRSVLQKFREKGLKLNIKKCHLFQKEVNYLGRIVSRDGYRMDQKNIDAVKDLKNRNYENVGQIRQLLGLLGFHRRHIQDFATISKPLTDLLVETEEHKQDDKNKGPVKSKQKIKWEEKHQQALTKLINLVTNPPILAYPDMEKPFFVHTDASGQGLGAILYQKQEDKTRVIAYGSRSLKPSEKNYHSTKLELLALKWAITDKFRDYLSYADHFDIYSDNNPLLFIMNLKKPNSCLQRWTSELAEFNFAVHYRPGKVNRDADCLSRLPLDIDKYVGLCKEEGSIDTFQVMLASMQVTKLEGEVTIKPNLNECSNVNTLNVEVQRKLEMKENQEEDTDISAIINLLKIGEVKKDQLTESGKLLLKEKKKLYLDEDQILRRRSGNHSQIVLPTKLKEMIYKSLHDDMGHIGAEKVISLARQRVYWPNMRGDIEEYTQKRCICLSQRQARRQPVAPLVSIHSSSPLELVGINYLKLERSSAGHSYILVITDHFTRYSMCYPTKNKSALTAAKYLYNDFILKFGLPTRLIHDQGREFDNKIFDELQNFCGIIKSRTTPYHPQCNGAVERMNSTLLNMLRTLPENQKSEWHKKLSKLMFAYNAAKHSSTGYSPYFLLFGRDPVLPVDFCLKNLPQDPARTKQYNKFVDEWEEQMAEAYQIAKENCTKVKEYNEKQWKRRLIANELLPGDKVLVRNKSKSIGPTKIRARWEQKIYEVVRKHENGVTYDIKNITGNLKQRTLHRNMLLPCEMMEELTPEEIVQPVTTRKLRSHTPSPSLNEVEDEDDPNQDEEEEDMEMIISPEVLKDMSAQIETHKNTSRGNHSNQETIINTETEADPVELETPVETEVEENPETTENSEMTESQETESGIPEKQTRIRRPPKQLTYYQLGGNPVSIDSITTEQYDRQNERSRENLATKVKTTSLWILGKLYEYMELME